MSIESIDTFIITTETRPAGISASVCIKLKSDEKMESNFPFLSQMFCCRQNYHFLHMYIKSRKVSNIKL